MRILRSRSPERAGAERRGRVRVTVLALCAVGLVSQRASAQLLVDPLEVTILTAGAGRAAATFSLQNTSDRPVQATLSRQDWDRQENGDNRFLAAGSSGKSCGSMLSVSPLSVRVEPHTSRVIRLAVQTDAALTRECWDIVFVEEVPQRAAANGNSLQYIFRTGVKVYIAPPGLQRDGAIEDMAVVDAPAKAAASTTPARPASTSSAGMQPGGKQIAIRFHNTGGMHMTAKGRVEFRRLDNSLATQVPIGEFPTLPGAVRKVLVDVPRDLPAGDYVALALIDFGGAELVAGQIDYQVK
ncbi:MAG TPA: fimbria/pilus periplasmic chaperone [Gemmatimonadaceae bacterium]|nr:fimbria/pilus periplasmic chaperone [Gemmatimonadaceae bacterium]